MYRINFSFRPQGQRIAAVAETAVRSVEAFLFIKGAVAVGVAKSKDAFGLVGLNKQAVVRIEKPSTFFKGLVDEFGSRDGFVSFGKCIANQPLVFAANCEATLRIKRQADP